MLLCCKLISEFIQENPNDETLIVKKFNINTNMFSATVTNLRGSVNLLGFAQLFKTQLLETIVRKTHSILEIISKHQVFQTRVNFHLRVISLIVQKRAAFYFFLKYSCSSYIEFFFISQTIARIVPQPFIFQVRTDYCSKFRIIPGC